jgi:hypothetical protein
MVGGMHATDFVAKTGDTMTGNLSLPSNGLRVGTNQLVVTGGNVGVGTTAGLMYKLDVAGDIRANGGWLRTTGTNGWLNENFGGGWFMNDSSWIRAYNDKNISTGGQMQAGTLRGNLVCIGNDCRTSWPAVNTISSTCTFPSGYAGWKPCYCPTGYSVTGQFGYGCEVHNILGISGCFQTYYDGTNAAQFYHDGSTAAYVGVWCVRTIP